MSRKSREGFYLLWTIAILISVAFCIFLLIYVSFIQGPEVIDAPPQDMFLADPAADPNSDIGADQLPGQDQPQQDATPESSPTPAPTILGETLDLGAEYLNKIVFLGDSTTYGLRAYSILPRSQVWTPASGTLTLSNYAIETIDYYADANTDTAQSLSIADCAAQRQPEYLVITLGLNGITFLDETSFKQYYTSLINDIQAASPNTKIICNSIFPVVDSMAAAGIDNASINAANSWILDVATQTGTRYLNTHDALTDSTGNLPVEYNSGDGIHLMPDCYNLILEYVRTHAYQ